MNAKPRRLLLLRHAEAAPPAGPGTPEEQDLSRPLTQDGGATARLRGEMMHREDLRPDLVLCSPARRTRETCAELFRDDAAPPEILIEPALWMASPDQILDCIRTVPDDTNTLLVTGHNPGIGQLTRRLCGVASPADHGFPPAALACFRVETS